MSGLLVALIVVGWLVVMVACMAFSMWMDRLGALLVACVVMVGASYTALRLVLAVLG